MPFTTKFICELASYIKKLERESSAPDNGISGIINQYKQKLIIKRLSSVQKMLLTDPAFKF